MMYQMTLNKKDTRDLLVMLKNLHTINKNITAEKLYNDLKNQVDIDV